MLVALPRGDFHREAEDIHNRWFEVLCQEQVHYNDNRAKKASSPFKRANTPSDIAVTVNINAEFNLCSI